MKLIVKFITTLFESILDSLRDQELRSSIIMSSCSPHFWNVPEDMSLYEPRLRVHLQSDEVVRADLVS